MLTSWCFCLLVTVACIIGHASCKKKSCKVKDVPVLEDVQNKILEDESGNQITWHEIIYYPRNEAVDLVGCGTPQGCRSWWDVTRKFFPTQDGIGFDLRARRNETLPCFSGGRGWTATTKTGVYYYIDTRFETKNATTLFVNIKKKLQKKIHINYTCYDEDPEGVCTNNRAEVFTRFPEDREKHVKEAIKEMKRLFKGCIRLDYRWINGYTEEGCLQQR